MKKQRVLLFIIISILISVVAEFTYNLDWKVVGDIYKYPGVMDELAVEEAEMLGCHSEEERIHSDGDDPRIIFRNVDIYASSVLVEYSGLSHNSMPIAVYYNREDSEYSEENCARSLVRSDRTYVYLRIDSDIRDLRIDIGDEQNASFILKGVTVNPGIGTYLSTIPGQISFARLFLFFVVAVCLLYSLTDTESFLHNLHKYRYPIAGIVIVIYTLLKLHGSSIGSLSEMMQSVDTGIIIGKNRPIRSDEYIAFTQMALSQVRSGFKWFSDIWGYSPSDMFIVYGQPILNPVTVFRPFSVGYILLGAERGLSFYWVTRIVACLLVSYEFGRVLTKDDRALSFIYAVSVIFAPVVQWWFSTNEFIEMLIAGQGAILIIYAYIHVKKILFKALLALGIAYLAGVYVLALYPAWMIPLAYVFLAAAIAVIVENRKNIKIKYYDLIIWFCAIVLFVACFIYIYSRSGDTIKTILATAYPGKRTYAGGPIHNVIELFRSWTGYIWSFIDTANPCEEVCFISFFPIGIILSCIVLFKKKVKDPWLISLNAVNVLLIVYATVPLPGIIGKLTLLNKSHYLRIVTIIGFLNLMIFIRALYIIKGNDLKSFKPVFVTVSILSTLVSLTAIDEKQTAVVGAVVLTVSVLFGIILSNINLRSWKAALVGYCFALAVIGGVMVNPLSRGLKYLYNEPHTEAIMRINDEKPGTWMTIGSYFYSNLPAALGADTISALDTYPDVELWNTLGLEGKSDIWNRYAHKIVVLDDKTSLELEQDDRVKLSISVMDLKKLGVNYLFSIGKLDDTEDIEEIYSHGAFSIYRVCY